MGATRQPRGWTERGRDLEAFKHDYWALPATFNPGNSTAALGPNRPRRGMKYVVFTTSTTTALHVRHAAHRLPGHRAAVPFHTTPLPMWYGRCSTRFRRVRHRRLFLQGRLALSDYWIPRSRPARAIRTTTPGQPEKWQRFVGTRTDRSRS